MGNGLKEVEEEMSLRSVTLYEKSESRRVEMSVLIKRREGSFRGGEEG